MIDLNLIESIPKNISISSSLVFSSNIVDKFLSLSNIVDKFLSLLSERLKSLTVNISSSSLFSVSSLHFSKINLFDCISLFDSLLSKLILSIFNIFFILTNVIILLSDNVNLDFLDVIFSLLFIHSNLSLIDLCNKILYIRTALLYNLIWLFIIFNCLFHVSFNRDILLNF